MWVRCTVLCIKVMVKGELFSWLDIIGTHFQPLKQAITGITHANKLFEQPSLI